MVDGYYLWKVTFSYPSPEDRAGARLRKVYTVLARDKDKAETKSFAHFSETTTYTDLRLSREGMVQTTVTKIERKKIALPRLTLAGDRDDFSIVPRLSADGRSLEYLVTERKGR